MVKNVFLKPSSTVLTAHYANGDTVIVNCDATGAAFTVTLPDATNTINIFFIIIKTDSSTNAITIAGRLGQTINGSTTATLSTQYESKIFLSNTNDWMDMSYLGHVRLHTVLNSSDHSDTLTGTGLDGDTIIGNVTPKWSRLAISIPAANVRNVFGVDNGELRPSWKTALDSTAPTAITVGATGAAGTSRVFANRDHTH